LYFNNLSNESAVGSDSISTQSLPENGLLLIKDPKKLGKLIAPKILEYIVHYLGLMPTKKEKTPKKKGVEQSYWIKSEEDNDVFIPRVCVSQQIEANSIPRVQTRQSTLFAATCSVETVSARELVLHDSHVSSHRT